MGGADEDTRANEWYVPRIGSRRFRALIGMTFLPYTLVNVSYIVIGSLLSPVVHFDRLGAMALVYLLAVGVSAHALDATGPNKPWGGFLARRQLIALASVALVPALAIGLYYALYFAPILLVLGSFELFFLLSYNLELFDGYFHTDLWFAVSWGFLPVLVGYGVQTDSLSLAAVAGGLFGFSTAYAEINASRPYKALKKQALPADPALASRLESILKGVVATVLAAAAFLLAYRLLG
ncbi:MAG: hypothetical protein HY297_05985 [Thaumarchaeota archaeon]|nr:hypothetical protein [Nitrososphaerota archaeon]